MFDKEYTFKGKHADMVLKLTSTFSIPSVDGTNTKKMSFFERNFDVYLLAPIIGFLYNRKADIDKEPTKISETESKLSTTKIWADIQINNIDDLQFNYRLIMLLDKNNEPSLEKRIDKAFRGIKNEDDEKLYESYVRGGVEVLYEKLLQDANTYEDYINKLYDFLEEFSDRYNDNIDVENILKLCNKVKS